MKLYDLFPNPIFGIDYPEHDKLKKIILQIMEECKDDFEFNGQSSNLSHLKNKLNESILHEEQLKEFKDWVEETCSDYVTDCLGYNLQEKMMVTDSWLNKCDKGGSQHPHYHSNSYVSGTYYVNFQDGHAPLMFNKRSALLFPNHASIVLPENDNFITKYNTDSAVYPEEGELYLWQSQMTHSVPENGLDNRISLSMNFMPTVVSNTRYGFRVEYLS
jgi:uncharacterized protein (TIGR02466 family)